jgi:catechol 2,3-dioxygenase-like lactoylglutathione lyase family enzyme
VKGGLVISIDSVSTRPKLVAAEPQLFVADVDASCAFFKGKLGFSIVFTYGEPPYYDFIIRDIDGNLLLFAGPAA